ncbi:MAG: hypothetical protein UU93_C0028G0001, partial [Candidatus Amesbacteria bacterium GW2011_GWA2_42_12]
HKIGLRSVSEKENGEMTADLFCRTAKRARVASANSYSGFQIQEGDFSEMRRFVICKANYKKDFCFQFFEEAIFAILI